MQITYPFKALPRTTDPHRIELLQDVLVARQLHRGLMRLNEKMEPALDLAESVQAEDQERRYIFKLKAMDFDDGVPLTAKHVVQTFRRMFRLNAAMASDFSMLKGAAQSLGRNGDALGVVAIDDLHVEFQLEKPSAMFLTFLTLVDSAVFKWAGDLETGKILGLGAYRLAENTTKFMRLEPRAGDSSSLPIQFVEVESFDSAFASASEGRLDTLESMHLTTPQAHALESEGWYRSVSTKSAIIFMILNPDRVSLALRARIQKAVMTSGLSVRPEGFTPLYGVVPNGFPGALNLADLTWPKDKVTEEKPVVVRFELGNKISAQVAQETVNVLAAQKIVARTEPFLSDNYLATLQNSDFEIMLVNKGMEYPDGLSILSYFRSKLPSNFFFIADEEVDRELDSLSEEASSEVRAGRYKKLQISILNQRTVLPLLSGSFNLGLWSPGISGVEPHPLGPHTLDFAKIRKA